MSETSREIKILAARFEECVSVLNILPGGVSQGVKSFWPDIIFTQAEIDRQEKRKITYMRPLPDAIDRAEETLGWITWVDNADHRKLIWLRARRLPWRAIARETGLPKSTAMRHWRGSLWVIYKYLEPQWASVERRE